MSHSKNILRQYGRRWRRELEEFLEANLEVNRSAQAWPRAVVSARSVNPSNGKTSANRTLTSAQSQIGGDCQPFDRLSGQIQCFIVGRAMSFIEEVKHGTMCEVPMAFQHQNPVESDVDEENRMPPTSDSVRTTQRDTVQLGKQTMHR